MDHSQWIPMLRSLMAVICGVLAAVPVRYIGEVQLMLAYFHSLGAVCWYDLPGVRAAYSLVYSAFSTSLFAWGNLGQRGSQARVSCRYVGQNLNGLKTRMSYY